MQGDGESDQFGVGGRRVIPKNVTIYLIELPKSAFLRFFKPVKGGDAEPFDRLPKIPRSSRYQARQGRGHFRSHTDVPLSLVDKAEQLRFQLLSTLFFVQLDRFQGG